MNTLKLAATAALVVAGVGVGGTAGAVPLAGIQPVLGDPGRIETVHFGYGHGYGYAPRPAYRLDTVRPRYGRGYGTCGSRGGYRDYGY